MAKKATTESKLRIRLAAYDSRVIDQSVKTILDIALRAGATVRGPVPLPTEIKKYTVNRSVFVHKDAREQFEIRTHRRLIDIVNPSAKIIESLTSLNLPSGVSVEVKSF
jgi:small subunit ribosomal protein S10